MASPDWNSLALDDGVLVEAAGGGDRVALWVRLERDREFEYWDRVVARPRDERAAAGGVRWAPATAVRTKRRAAGGRLGRIFARLAGGPSDACWIMPDGRAAERCGDRRAGLALAWANDGIGMLNEERLEGLWRGDVQLLRLGGRLVLASGVEAAAAGPDDVAEDDEEPAATATRFLKSARAAGDRLAEAAALADLGASWAKDGRPEAALGPLHEALALRRTLGDRGGEADVLVDLGRALEALGRPHESRRALEAAFALADGLGDAFARKAVLERLGDALARRGDPAGAAAALARAGESARAAGDRRHEARLLWLEAAAWAEAGRPDLALARAGESVASLRSAGAAESDWYEAQLRRYRPDASGGAAASPTRVVGDPGILRMAASATRAMATFLGSGMRTTTAEERDRRLATCRACVHHTGLRCRICGCFTRAKAAMPHEQCPAGRW